MSVQDLKALIINRVNNTEDEGGLALLAEVVDQVLPPLIEQNSNLTEAELQAALRGRSQIAANQSYTHEQMRQRVADAIVKGQR